MQPVPYRRYEHCQLHETRAKFFSWVLSLYKHLFSSVDEANPFVVGIINHVRTMEGGGRHSECCLLFIMILLYVPAITAWR
ncbi:hypothetical protein BDZ91DRAFT_735129 [Kalaharituber pfeilii]|nr:hypothetical protein BDZ91DRAFT_735129 [Kalaharituber pfeilii]